MSLRIIAKLDVKPPIVVKPVHFEGLRKVGVPSELALKYYQQGADEVMYVDIVASLYQREILYKYIEETANELFIPLGVGGGVRSVDDFSKLFHTGADKVLVNTSVLQNDPSLIEDAARVFGAQSVVLNVEAKKWSDHWECYSDCGRIRSGRSVIDWVSEAVELGVGEVMLQSVDCDGRRRGFDIDLVASVTDAINVPVIAASGAGSLKHILDVVQNGSPDAVAIASLLHYDIATVKDIKLFLIDNGVEVSL